MKNGVVVCIALALVACGSSSSSNPTVTGTIGGASFTAADVEALYVAPASCNFNSAGVTGTVSVAGLVLAFSTKTGLCSDLTTEISSGACVAHASSASVELFIADVGITALGGQASIVTGKSYPVINDPTQVVIGGTTFSDSFGYSTRLDATCVPTSTTPVTASGTIVLTSITSSEISGHVDVTFTDHGTLNSDFTAPVCNANLDICAVANAAIASQGTPISICTPTNTCD
jgi:hypothetical protein